MFDSFWYGFWRAMFWHNIQPIPLIVFDPHSGNDKIEFVFTPHSKWGFCWNCSEPFITSHARACIGQCPPSAPSGSKLYLCLPVGLWHTHRAGLLRPMTLPHLLKGSSGTPWEGLPPSPTGPGRAPHEGERTAPMEINLPPYTIK